MKKLNKLFAILVAMAMVLSMGIIAAFAEDPVPQTELANAVLNKQLATPAGVTTNPQIEATFKFELDRSKSTGLTDAEKLTTNTTLDIADKKVTVNGEANKVTAAQLNLSSVITEGFFKHAGVYAYTVSEPDDPTVKSPANDTNASAKKDTTTYTVRFYVKPVTATPEGETDPVTTYEVDYVTVNKNTTDDADASAGKVDASKTDGTGFNFLNNYTYTNGSEPQDPEKPTPGEKENFALVVEKEVTNKTGDETTFPISVKLTKALGQTENTVKGIVYKAGENGNYAKDREEEFTYGEAKVVNLKTGEWLGFATLPTGTTWTTSENLDNQDKYLAYTPSYTGVATETKTETNTTGAISGNAGAGQTLATPTAYILQQAGKDKIKYTNAYDNTINTPTGILMNNLPYIALALVAIGGLVAYVIVRRRQDDEV